MALLNQDKADALCMAVTLGFIEANEKKTGLKTHFIYESPDEATAHTGLSTILRKYGLAVAISQQTSAYEMPLIVATTQTISSTTGLMDRFHRLIQMNKALVDKSKKALCGAYIGGLMKGSNSIEFIGPSYLYLKKPQYRDSDDGNIGESFETAKNVSNELIKLLRDGRKSIPESDVRYTLADSVKEVTDTFATGSIFASCHGMTMAINKYGGTIGADPCIELAYGKDTTKVASCIPCSMFMTSVGTPASATHFGRGDNWNFPKDMIETTKEKWKKAVRGYYAAGLALISAKSPPIGTLLADITPKADKIPDIFLEALTFEKSFMNRIKEIDKNYSV